MFNLKQVTRKMTPNSNVVQQQTQSDEDLQVKQIISQTKLEVSIYFTSEVNGNENKLVTYGNKVIRFGIIFL